MTTDLNQNHPQMFPPPQTSRHKSTPLLKISSAKYFQKTMPNRRRRTFFCLSATLISLLLLLLTTAIVSCSAQPNGTVRMLEKCQDRNCSATIRCPDLDVADCPHAKRRRGTCECCEQCIRDRGEECGRDGDICAEGMRCLADHVTGERHCTAVSSWPERCLHAKCRVVFPKCDWDSKAVVINSRDRRRDKSINQEQVDKDQDECCPGVECQCAYQKCHQIVPQCGPGLERVLVRAGTHKPGSCCDRFECRQPELHCEHVKCPDSSETLDFYTTDEGKCPNDSYRPIAYVPEGACCPIIPQCTCKAAICAPARCAAAHERLVIEKKGTGQPGKCCDQFQCVRLDENDDGDKIRSPETTDGEKDISASVSLATSDDTLCMHEGHTYAEGEHWHQDPCQMCNCNGGVALCQRMECPSVAPGCAWIEVPDGDCCPLCLGCRSDNGTGYTVGERWARDDCTNCTCAADFRWQCQKSICKSECESPRQVPGQCCPVCEEGPMVIQSPVICPSLDLCPLRCNFGLVRNDWGCFECKCAEPPGTPELSVVGDFEVIGTLEPENASTSTVEPNSNCSPLTQENCEKQCAHGYLRDWHDCPVCRCANCPPIDQCYKHCLYGFETNSLGCPLCKCRPKRLIDVRLLINVNRVESQSGSCVSVSEGGGQLIRRDSGEWWTDSQCRQCFCQQSKEFCSLVACPSRPTDCPVERWIRRKGDCCAMCHEELTEDEDHYQHRDNVRQKQHFLAVCHSPGTGRLFVDGETWQLDECTSCTCRVGHVLCSTKECPPLACDQNHQVKDEHDRCCSRCSGFEESMFKVNATDEREPSSETEELFCTDGAGDSHAIGSSWRLNDCTSCRCESSGKTQCYHEKCAASGETQCASNKWLMVKGRCCPICSDALSSDAVCVYGRNVYGLNEEFQDGPCRNCSCRTGSTLECVEIQCPTCKDAEPIEGECCPECKDKSTELYLFGGGESETVFVESNDQSETSNLGNNQPTLYFYALLSIVVAFGCALICLLVTIFSRKIMFTSSNTSKKTPLPSVAITLENNRRFATPAFTQSNNNKLRNSSECESASVSLLSANSEMAGQSSTTSATFVSAGSEPPPSRRPNDSSVNTSSLGLSASDHE